MRIRIFLISGDELDALNACEAVGARLELGGPPEYDGRMGGWERPPEDSFHVRTNWIVAYVCCDRLVDAYAARVQFRHIAGFKMV